MKVLCVEYYVVKADSVPVCFEYLHIIVFQKKKRKKEGIGFEQQNSVQQLLNEWEGVTV